MAEYLFPALISFLGAIITILITVYLNRRQISIDLDKFRDEILQGYNAKLFEKRLEVYPELYNHLSDFVNTVQYETITTTSIKQLVDQLHSWRKHSILFTANTGAVAYGFSRRIHELSNLSDEQLQAKYSSNEEKLELRREIQKLELALKNELGIYSFEAPTKIKATPDFRSYAEVSASIPSNSSGNPD